MRSTGRWREGFSSVEKSFVMSANGLRILCSSRSKGQNTRGSYEDMAGSSRSFWSIQTLMASSLFFNEDSVFHFDSHLVTTSFCREPTEPLRAHVRTSISAL